MGLAVVVRIDDAVEYAARPGWVFAEHLDSVVLRWVALLHGAEMAAGLG